MRHETLDIRHETWTMDVCMMHVCPLLSLPSSRTCILQSNRMCTVVRISYLESSLRTDDNSGQQLFPPSPPLLPFNQSSPLPLLSIPPLFIPVPLYATYPKILNFQIVE